MYAIVKTGGKQYKVAKDDKIVIEKIAGEKGATISLDEVLLVGDEESQTIGAPLVKGASVTATVLDQTRDKKIIVFKKKRRKNYRRKNGHRQDITILKITDILTGAKKKAAPKKKEAKAKEPAEAKTDTTADATDKTEE
ncbi:MAG: 50S ribosomal protein L21 [Alphaproteobacteria bacterium]|nr:50S ribosomal protein L21 [Alphaproteobacteria bacterium]